MTGTGRWSLQRRLRLEAWFGDGLLLATVIWIVFGALPMIALLIGELFTGSPKDGQIPEGYPAFLPPWWAAYPQTLLLAALAIGSLALPLRGPRATRRGTLAILLALSVSTTMYLMVATGAAEAHAGRLNFFGLDVLVLIQMGLFALTVVRMILGALHVLPQRWREYVSDDAVVIPPKEIVRPAPRRPWRTAGRRAKDSTS